MGVRWKVAFAFCGGFMASMILSGWVPHSLTCRLGDLTSGITADQKKDLERSLGAWIHNVRECRVGDYIVDAPAREGSRAILVSRQKHMVLGVSKDAVMLMDDDGQHLLYRWDQATGLVSYSPYDATQRAWIENYNVDPAGTIDRRSVETAVAPRPTDGSRDH